MTDYEKFEKLEWDGWQERALGYDDATLRMTGASIGRLLQVTAIQPGQRVLDVCCGTGEVARQMSDLGAEVVGLDFAPDMVAQAQKKIPAADILLGDAQNLPFGDAEFDAVVTNFGHYHLADADRAIAEAARVLKPGGRYGFTTWLGPDHSPGFRMIFDTVLGNIDPNITLPAAPDAFRLADPTIAGQVMAQAGFSGISTEEFASTIICEPTELVAFLKAATVRATMVLKAQPEAIRRKIEQLLQERVQQFVVEDKVVLPIPNLIISGRRI